MEVKRNGNNMENKFYELEDRFLEAVEAGDIDEMGAIE